MKNERLLPSKKVIFGIVGFLLAMMVVGSFFDLSLSNLVYNESNLFGIFFAAYGEYPALLGIVAAGAMLILNKNPKKKVISVVQIILGVFFLLSGTAMAALMPTIYLSLPVPIVATIGVLCSAGMVFLVIKLTKSGDRELIIRFAAIILIVVFAEMVLVNIVKIPWGRPRMRLIANDTRAYFTPWWKIGGELKEILVAAGIKGEEFKSFPSGHTANATIMMMLGLLPIVKPEWSNLKDRLYILGFVWAFLVAFSRIVIGAHFLTDTIVGLFITFIIILIAGGVAESKQKNIQL